MHLPLAELPTEKLSFTWRTSFFGFMLKRSGSNLIKSEKREKGNGEVRGNERARERRELLGFRPTYPGQAT
jgi:hypothetical protein